MKDGTESTHSTDSEHPHINRMLVACLLNNVKEIEHATCLSLIRDEAQEAKREQSLIVLALHRSEKLVQAPPKKPTWLFSFKCK